MATQKTETSPYAWVPSPHEDQRRPQRHQAPSPERPEASNRLSFLFYSVRRRYRLRSRERFQEVRRKGRSVKDPLVILVYLRNDLPYSRFGFTASRRVGNAVQRNRARRLLRESIRLQLDHIEAGWDLVLIARPAILKQSFQQVDVSCKRLLAKAHLLTSSVAVPPEKDEIL